MLEVRNLLSTFTVDHLADDMVGQGLYGSLRYCITNATDGDDITFGDGVTGTISLTGALPDLNHSISIEGPGPDQMMVRRDDNAPSFRIFTVDSGPMVSIAGLTISNGAVSSNGGGLANLRGTLTLTDCTVSGNSAGYGGGGLLSNGPLTLTRCTVSGNYSYVAGGIYGGPATLTDCTVSGNSAGYGGGIVGGGLTLTNCTISGNSATGSPGSNGYGGGISCGGAATLTACTVSGNFAGGDGSGLLSNGLATLTNTIVAGNTGSPNIEGSFSGSHNLIGGNPLLGPLQDNGGPTQTMALLAGSPALNAGDPTQLGTPDQRGVIRTGGINIGGFQASATAFLVSAPDIVRSGVQFDVTLTAVDPFNQVAVGYTGTVTFSTSDTDPGVVLPADYAFRLGDGGVHTFTDTGLGETTLITPGDQMLNVMDTADNTITGSATVTVNAGPGPAPHGQGPPPSTLQPSPGQGDAWTRSEPSANEVVASDLWFVSFQPSDQGSATFMVTLNTQGPVNLTVTDTADNTVFASLDLIVL
jgi:hypothetical protein